MAQRSPFDDLSQAQLRELLLRLRLYAQWKVRAASHRDVGLDPQDLALRAVADTLDGTRHFNRDRFDLLKHLTNCIDSYVSHRYASAAVRREVSGEESSELALRTAAATPGPEEHVSVEHEVRDLCTWVARHHPRLMSLLRLVVNDGLSLADRRGVALALGLDPDESAQMQRVYRQINALKDAVACWQRQREGAAK